MSGVTIIALVASLPLVGCGGSKHRTITRSSTHSPSTAAGQSAARTTTQAPTPSRTVATETYNLLTGNKQQETRSVYDLRRQGPYLVLDFGLSCPVAAQAQADCDTSYTFSPDSEPHPGDVGYQPSRRLHAIRGQSRRPRRRAGVSAGPRFRGPTVHLTASVYG